MAERGPSRAELGLEGRHHTLGMRDLGLSGRKGFIEHRHLGRVHAESAFKTQPPSAFDPPAKRLDVFVVGHRPDETQRQDAGSASRHHGHQIGHVQAIVIDRHAHRHRQVFCTHDQTHHPWMRRRDLVDRG